MFLVFIKSFVLTKLSSTLLQERKHLVSGTAEIVADALKRGDTKKSTQLLSRLEGLSGLHSITIEMYPKVKKDDLLTEQFFTYHHPIYFSDQKNNLMAVITQENKQTSNY